MKEAQDKLRQIAKKLFAEKKADLLIGFERGSLPSRSRPVFIRGEADVNRLVWDSTCSNNLAVYLPELHRRKRPPRGMEAPALPRIAIVVKGCDALSIAGLVREHQAARDRLIVIGMPCAGIANPETGEVAAVCLECRHAKPEGADILVPGEYRKPAPDRQRRTADLDGMSAGERWAYFSEQISKCIRCYACRQACPNCYCKECFADQTNPRWIAAGDDSSDTMLYHLGRIFHQAGRCVECGACVRACPMGVDIRSFTRRLSRDAGELFGFEAGEVLEEKPLLCRFSDRDGDDFITDPEKKT